MFIYVHKIHVLFPNDITSSLECKGDLTTRSRDLLYVYSKLWYHHIAYVLPDHGPAQM